MCLGKIVLTGAGTDRQEIGDVVDIRMDDNGVSVSTLFGEEHRFEDVAIEHIAMRSGVTVSLVARVAA
ncbi:CooT family nickel-binding protein [Sphingomonas abietis]|uniref:CooT family nickel-binding protein n=1 Tax=Sphingomonas abietis TaxID=3012344 RepID=A0ABY7NU22_9SPHN|nr:CooT family nickel-binding protein [Sphingomonas abietis]WBO24395.1 CooT family nickel-binding protein [Sphingomonas abietis]